MNCDALLELHAELRAGKSIEGVRDGTVTTRAAIEQAGPTENQRQAPAPQSRKQQNATGDDGEGSLART